MLDAQGTMPNAPTIPTNVGVILLSREESLLFNESKQLSLEKQSHQKWDLCLILNEDVCVLLLLMFYHIWTP
jgi:hypothetical protein